MISRASIKKLRDTLSPHSYFSSRGLNPKKVGANYQIHCPFHKEKTPSCVLYNDHFYCFGCRKSGDVITAHRILNNVDFRTAYKELCQMTCLNNTFELGDPSSSSASPINQGKKGEI
jgi:DNA primase